MRYNIKIEIAYREVYYKNVYDVELSNYWLNFTYIDAVGAKHKISIKITDNMRITIKVPLKKACINE